MAKEMIPVAIESPYAGDVERNTKYAQACVKDCLNRGESAYASHLFFTQVLDDTDPDQRNLGMRAGKALEKLMSKTVVYTDLGISSGMEWGITEAEKCGRAVEFRELGGEWAGKYLKHIQSPFNMSGSMHIWKDALLNARDLHSGTSDEWQTIIDNALETSQKDLDKQTTDFQFSSLVEALAVGIPFGYEVVIQETETELYNNTDTTCDEASFRLIKRVKVRVLPEEKWEEEEASIPSQ